MAESKPYAQLVGPIEVYLAAASTAEPDVDADPTGSGYTRIGALTGDKTQGSEAPNTYFYDDDHMGPTKAVTPQQDDKWTFIVADLTHQNFARLLFSTGAITTDAGPPAISSIPFKQGYIPGEYTLLFRGEADSPFGNLPAQSWVPRVVFEKTYQLTRNKTVRADLAVEARTLEDDSQSDSLKMGRTTAQTA